MTSRLSFALATAVATLSGCVAGSDAKGEEDDIPLDGKDDSFVNPTAHGPLVFGIPSHAEFSDTEGFHSWTFTLTGDAQVDLRTALHTPNLDTVMYLYQRTSPSASWGAYVARNDDAHADTAASQLASALAAGEYRVLIKAYKRTQRGAFSLASACTGAGCPPVEVCEAPVDLPADTGYGGTCGDRVAAVFHTGLVASTSSLALAADERCTAPALQRTAIDYYLSYWDGSRRSRTRPRWRSRPRCSRASSRRAAR